MAARIDDTYAEAFRSLYTEFLITARDQTWVKHAVDAAVGNAASTILCDCEAGLDRLVGPGGDESFETPDGRPGAIVQLHVPRFWKDRVAKLERAALVRISQNVLTCPTASCFNLLDTEEYYQMGRKVAYFGNGKQKRIERFGRKMWWVPILGGEFVLDRRLGYADRMQLTREADILVAAAGSPGIISAEHVKPGAAVFDVGVSRVDGTIRGDVQFDLVREVVDYITPMPGGTGPMTVACLMANTVKAALHSSGN